MKLLMIFLIISATADDLPPGVSGAPHGPLPGAPPGPLPGDPPGPLPGVPPDASSGVPPNASSGVPSKGGQTECVTPKPCGEYALQETAEPMTSEQCRSLEEYKKCHDQQLQACSQQQYTGKDEDIQTRARKQQQLEHQYKYKCTNSSTGHEEEEAGISVQCGQVYLCGSGRNQTLPENMTEEECREFDKSRRCYRSSLEDCRTKEYINKEQDIAQREENMKKLDDTYGAKCAAYTGPLAASQAECLNPGMKPCEGYAVQETPETMTSEQCRSLEEDKNCHHQLLLACGQQYYTGKDEDMVKRERKQMQLENDYIAKCTKMTSAGASTTTLSALCVLCGFVGLLF